MQKTDLYSTVIQNDYCIGCGACSFVNENYKIEMDEFGMFKANIATRNSIQESDPALAVCPFSNDSQNEDIISERIFKNAPKHSKYIGKYSKNYVGYVKEGDFRKLGSSGGFGKWVLNELLKTDEVDYVIQVVSNKEKGKLYTFEIFSKDDDVLKGSKSVYYPVTMKEALDFIKNNEGRYAITAIPCFSKALRNVCIKDEEMAKRVKYIVGIICGHLKSTGFAESLAWQLDVKPNELMGIEFRGKIEGLNANEKGVYAVDDKNKKSRTESSKKLYGGNWGHGFFKYKACDFCDDVVGETTDISIGDAWIEELMSDHRGNNVLTVRNPRIAEIIEQAINDDRLSLTEIEEEIVVKSQAGGFRHRREGLSYRLFEKQKENEWVPNKRVKASNSMPGKRKKVYRLREEMREASHIAFKEAKEKGEYQIFDKKMRTYTSKLESTSFQKLKIRTLKIAKNFFK